MENDETPLVERTAHTPRPRAATAEFRPGWSRRVIILLMALTIAVPTLFGTIAMFSRWSEQNTVGDPTLDVVPFFTWFDTWTAFNWITPAWLGAAALVVASGAWRPARATALLLSPLCVLLGWIVGSVAEGSVVFQLLGAAGAAAIATWCIQRTDLEAEPPAA